jgi:hypothetical protein
MYVFFNLNNYSRRLETSGSVVCEMWLAFVASKPMVYVALGRLPDRAEPENCLHRFHAPVCHRSSHVSSLEATCHGSLGANDSSLR